MPETFETFITSERERLNNEREATFKRHTLFKIFWLNGGRLLRERQLRNIV